VEVVAFVLFDHFHDFFLAAYPAGVVLYFVVFIIIRHGSGLA